MQDVIADTFRDAIKIFDDLEQFFVNSLVLM